MRWRIVFASHNRGKAAEMAVLLPQIDLWTDCPGPDVEETGTSYGANALLKARAWARLTGLPSLADDSGLEVAALGGGPGIHSARVAPSDSERWAWILERLGGTSDRSAAFVAALAVVFPREGRVLVVEGRCVGQIARKPRGAGGFGYDPLFVPRGYGKTFGELDVEEKNAISHRARACRMLAHMLDAKLVL